MVEVGEGDAIDKVSSGCNLNAKVLCPDAKPGGGSPLSCGMEQLVAAPSPHAVQQFLQDGRVLSSSFAFCYGHT